MIVKPVHETPPEAGPTAPQALGRAAGRSRPPSGLHDVQLRHALDQRRLVAGQRGRGLLGASLAAKKNLRLFGPAPGHASVSEG